MTNGDRIRQMSNEELDESDLCDYCICSDGEFECEKTPCIRGILEYLNQEVSE